MRNTKSKYKPRDLLLSTLGKEHASLEIWSMPKRFCWKCRCPSRSSVHWVNLCMGEPTHWYILLGDGECCLSLVSFVVEILILQSNYWNRLKCCLVLNVHGFLEYSYTIPMQVSPKPKSIKPSYSCLDSSGCHCAWIVVVTHFLLLHQCLFVKCLWSRLYPQCWWGWGICSVTVAWCIHSPWTLGVYECVG